MTEDSRNNPSDSQKSSARRPWSKPTLIVYGPIGKLTQGKSGTRADGTSGKKR